MVSQFTRPYRYKTLLAKTNALLFEIQIPPNHVGFITAIGNKFGNNTTEVYADSYANFWIDGNLYESAAIDRQIADVHNPLVFSREAWIVVHEDIKYEQFNNTNNTHVYQVLINGFIYTENELKALLR